MTYNQVVLYSVPLLNGMQVSIGSAKKGHNKQNPFNDDSSPEIEAVGTAMKYILIYSHLKRSHEEKNQR